MATTKKKAKKAVKRKSTRSKKIAAKQGKSEVGYKKPPKETRFNKGESGNPAGPPVRRTQLWVWFCKFMALTDAKLAKLDRKKLTQAQQVALRLVENAKDGKYSGSERLARYCIDREEGRAVEHLVFENDIVMTDKEAEEIRQELRKRFETGSKEKA